MLNGVNAPLSKDSVADVKHSRNHKSRSYGPCVYGLKKGSICQYVYVIPIIVQKRETGSVIHSNGLL